MKRNSWDVVVVGAGIGGLTAAARLVRSGIRVLVLDRNPHVGGTAYVYRRKGFTFPMGPLGFSSPGRIQGYLEEMGTGPGVELNRVHYRMKALGLDVPLSLTFSELTRVYASLMPDQEEAIKGFFAGVERICDRLSGQLNESWGADGNLLTADGASRISAGSFLDDLGMTDPRLRRILGSLGTHEPYSSLSLLAAMWGLMARQGIYYPAGGMRTFCHNLAGRVLNSGTKSEIGLNSRVDRITINRGRATGVILSTGEEIPASSVISNADFKNTFLNLVPAESIPAVWLEQIRSSRQTASNFQICLGFHSNKVDLSLFNQATRIIYRHCPEGGYCPEPEMDWDRPEVSVDRLLRQEMELALWSADDSGLAPAEAAVLVIRTEADYDHFAACSPLPGRRSGHYRTYKLRLARAFMDHLERLFPGLTNNIMVADVATPLTYRDQGGRSRGAVAGWSWDFSDSREYRPRELVRTPVAGLYMAGYQAFSTLFSGGIPTAMESGLRAADAVLNRSEPDIPSLP